MDTFWKDIFYKVKPQFVGLIFSKIVQKQTEIEDSRGPRLKIVEWCKFIGLIYPLLTKGINNNSTIFPISLR